VSLLVVGVGVEVGSDTLGQLTGVGPVACYLHMHVWLGKAKVAVDHGNQFAGF